MRFSQDLVSNVNLIRGYGAGELRINNEVFRTAMIVAPSTLRPESELTAASGLGATHAAHLLELRPEVVLLGTGPKQVFPDPAFGAQFLAAGIGFEVMDTGAACRTFNVLVSEQRLVAALLIP